MLKFNCISPSSGDLVQANYAAVMDCHVKVTYNNRLCRWLIDVQLGCLIQCRYMRYATAATVHGGVIELAWL